MFISGIAVRGLPDRLARCALAIRELGVHVAADQELIASWETIQALRQRGPNLFPLGLDVIDCAM